MVILRQIPIMKMNTEYRYSSEPGRFGNFPKELAKTLASSLATNICIEIQSGEDGNPIHVELEECNDDLEDNEEIGRILFHKNHEF